MNFDGTQTFSPLPTPTFCILQVCKLKLIQLPACSWPPGWWAAKSSLTLRSESRAHILHIGSFQVLQCEKLSRAKGGVCALVRFVERTKLVSEDYEREKAARLLWRVLCLSKGMWTKESPSRATVGSLSTISTTEFWKHVVTLLCGLNPWTCLLLPVQPPSLSPPTHTPILSSNVDATQRLVTGSVKYKCSFSFLQSCLECPSFYYLRPSLLPTTPNKIKCNNGSMLEYPICSACKLG